MKDQRGIPHTEQIRIYSVFRGSASAELGVSQISITRADSEIFLRIFENLTLEFSHFLLNYAPPLN